MVLNCYPAMWRHAETSAPLDDEGLLTDRRAGRIPTAQSAPLCERLDRIEIPGVQVDVFPVQDYRFVLRLRGEGLSDQVDETDPQREGTAPKIARALNPEAQRTAEIVQQFVSEAGQMLAEDQPANMVLLRGLGAAAEPA